MSYVTEANLKEMLESLSKHKRDKNTLLSLYVEERLNKTVSVYYKEMLASARALSYYAPEKVLDRMSKNVK
jgi:hypothetical protein